MNLYLVISLSSCSPIHCKILVPIAGITCIMISLKAGSVVAFYMGYYEGQLHQALPILMLGIGVDDIIVIVKSID